MTHQELKDYLVTENLMFYMSMPTEDGDMFVKDILYALFARFTEQELKEELARLSGESK